MNYKLIVTVIMQSLSIQYLTTMYTQRELTLHQVYIIREQKSETPLIKT